MKYRHTLPQLNAQPILTDGGLETYLIFQRGWDFPHFAVFTLLDREGGAEEFTTYLNHYRDIARRRQLGLLLGTPTWRASADWGQLLGYDAERLAQANRQALAFLLDYRAEHERPETPMPIAGILGPRGDGYVPGAQMSVDEAAAYHLPQMRVMAEAGADYFCALTLNYLNEAQGILQASRDFDLPVALYYTVETDGKLPTGETLAEVITAGDAMEPQATYYGINCAHPTHFEKELAQGGAWTQRLLGIRANASCKSHAELDAATELDQGDPHRLGREIAALRRLVPGLMVFGGCCGTDHQHMSELAALLSR